MWETAQNWVIFGGIVGGLVYYYSPANKSASKAKPTQDNTAVPSKRDTKQTKRRTSPTRSGTEKDSGTDTKPKASNDSKKRPVKRVQVQDPAETAAAAAAVQDDDKAEEIDMSTRQFAQQMTKARVGSSLQAPKGKDQRIRTVKQGNAVDGQVQSSGSSQAGADADDDLSPVSSPALRAGDVSDMLEPVAAPPTTLRLVGEIKPQAQRKEKKEQVVETKKQRQNRLKVEERKAQREEEEKQRKALEEKQRRSAREARGEPAKNGVSIPAAPSQNPWSEPRSNKAKPAPATSNGGPLLDTFDAESTGSSVGAAGISTAATSATEGSNSRFDHDMSEEEQMARAMKQSEDESGWQTVNVAKKSKKKANGGVGSGDSTPVAAPAAPAAKKAAPIKKTAANGKPVGFQVLDVGETEPGADADPDNVDNWTA